MSLTIHQSDSAEKVIEDQLVLAKTIEVTEQNIDE